MNKRSRKQSPYARLLVEVLEDRCVPTATASGVVSGTTFFDANDNGVYNAATDFLLPGVMVTLSGTTAAQNTSINVTAITDANGAFNFANVLPGAYQLQSGPSTGLVGGTTSVGTVTAPTGVTITLAAPAAGSGNVGEKDVLNLANISMNLFLTTTTRADFPTGTPGSGRALANSRPDSLPTITNALANITATQGGSTTIDLAGNFTSPNYTNTQVTFHIIANSVPETVTVNLLDGTAPQAVANFLDYVNSGAYDNSIFNRLITSAAGSGGINILQGGATTLAPTATTGLKLIPSLPPVANEEAIPFTGTITSGSPIITNIGSTANLTVGMSVNASISGTVGIPAGATILNILSATSITLSANATATTTGIALAAVIPTSNPNAAFTLAAARGNNLNSATDQFYFNTANDSASLPDYTVFGTVTDPASQQVLTQLALTQANQTINNQNSSAAAAANPSVDMGNVPLNNNYSGTNFASDATAANFIVLKSVTVAPQDEVLTYTAQVTNNAGNVGANPLLVTATVANERLTLNYAAGQTGSATVIVTATDRFGAAVSSQPFTVTINAAPEITSAPVTLSGSVLTVTPVATPVIPADTPTFTYQWFQSGQPIPNATNSTLDLSVSPLGHVNVGDIFSVQITPAEASEPTGALFTSGIETVTATNPFAITP